MIENKEGLGSKWNGLQMEWASKGLGSKIIGLPKELAYDKIELQQVLDSKSYWALKELGSPKDWALIRIGLPQG